MLSYKKLGLVNTGWDKKYLLLTSCNSRLRALTGTCVVLGALPTDWQTTTVAQPLVGTNFNFAPNVGSYFTTQITFDLNVAFDVVAQLDHFVVRQIFDVRLRVDAG